MFISRVTFQGETFVKSSVAKSYPFAIMLVCKTSERIAKDLEYYNKSIKEIEADLVTCASHSDEEIKEQTHHNGFSNGGPWTFTWTWGEERKGKEMNLARLKDGREAVHQLLTCWSQTRAGAVQTAEKWRACGYVVEIVDGSVEETKLKSYKLKAGERTSKYP